VILEFPPQVFDNGRLQAREIAREHPAQADPITSLERRSEDGHVTRELPIRIALGGVDPVERSLDLGSLSRDPGPAEFGPGRKVVVDAHGLDACALGQVAEAECAPPARLQQLPGDVEHGVTGLGVRHGGSYLSAGRHSRAHTDKMRRALRFFGRGPDWSLW
jgi:hypothetical protein